MWKREDRVPAAQIKALGEGITDMTKLRDAVLQVGGVAALPSGVIREVCGIHALALHKRKEIAAALAEVGLGFVAQEIPNDQSEPLLLYVKDHAAGQIIDAVLDPSMPGTKLLQRAAKRLAG